MKRTSPGLLVVLLAVAGCAGDDSSFAEDYNRAVRPLAGLGQELGRDAAEFERLARLTERTRANLSGLEPPDGAVDELRGLRQRLREVSADLEAVAEATRAKDRRAQRRAARALVGSTERVQRAEQELQRAVGDAG